MEVIELGIEGLKLIKPKIFRDSRGFFMESYQKSRYFERGIQEDFVQDNFALSKKNTLRGMHFQTFPEQSKLVSVSKGAILDVAVDLRKSSKTFGQHVSVILDDESFFQLFIPAGFAHGYLVLSDTAKVHYKVNSMYNPEKEKSFRYDDPQINIMWPINNPILSEKDQSSPFFSLESLEEKK